MSSGPAGPSGPYFFRLVVAAVRFGAAFFGASLRPVFFFAMDFNPS